MHCACQRALLTSERLDTCLLALIAGIAFVGGFSYADVLDSGKGWAGTIRWNKRLEQQFTEFRQR